MNETCASSSPRFQPIDRTQIFLRTTDVESLIAEDHPARAIWLFLGRLDLSKFSAEQLALEGKAGRSAISPHLLLSIWIYSYTRGVSSARQISREMEYEPGLQWLAGMQVVNHHTLSDFRVAHGCALQNLMEQVLGILFSEGLVGLVRVTQDGTKIRAQASKRSFVDKNRLKQCIDLARRHMAEVDAEAIDQLSQRLEAARRRVCSEREAKLQSALRSLDTLGQPKKHSKAKAAHVSLSDPDARFMRHGDGAIAPSYNVQFTTDTAQGLVVGVTVSQAPNDAQELARAMDQFRKQYGSYPAQVVADGDFTNHQSVIAMHERRIEFFGSFNSRRLRRPNAKGGGTYRANLFTHDAKTDQMICPENKRLRFQYFDRHPGRTIRVYIAPMLAAENVTYYECQHVPPSGKKCRAIAIRGHHFCYFHLQARRGKYSSITPAETVANGGPAPAPQATTIAIPMLEDRSALQIALSEVLRAVAANQIDTNRGWLLLSGLRMASKNCTGEEEFADPTRSMNSNSPPKAMK
ncbi:MAG: transposase [Alloacidobacterium sp.]